MLMDFVIEAHHTHNHSKWQDFAMQKNKLYALYAVEAHEIKGVDVHAHANEIADDVIGIVTLDLNPFKLCLLGFLTLKELNKMTRNNFKSLKDVEEELVKCIQTKKE